MVRMTRRVGFSSGHRYWIPALGAAENRELFGRWASPYNHGHNYVLDVTVEGEVDPRTGMVVNIKRIDDVLRATIVAQFDQKSMNDEVPYFATRASTLENLVGYIAGRLSPPDRPAHLLLDQRELEPVLPPEVRLVRLRLEETPLLYAELDMTTQTVSLTRVYEFAASHRLDSPHLSPEENLALFGKCNNPAGHGHNYSLEVTVCGIPDERTGMMCPLDELDAKVNELVVDRYDHKNLNEDVPELRGRTTTSEVLTQEIFARLEGRLPARLARVRLWETARNAFEVASTG